MLQDLETIKQLGHILKTNVRACVAVGHPFVMQVNSVIQSPLYVREQVYQTSSLANADQCNFAFVG